MSGTYRADERGVYIRVDEQPELGSRSFRNAVTAIQRAITSKGGALFGEQHSTVAPALWARSKGQIALFERWTGTRWSSVASLSNDGTLDVATAFTVAGSPIGGGGGGTPASTVADETAYGLAKAVGISTSYAREDHTHGSPTSTALTAASTVTDETAFGVAKVVGVSTAYARQDHTHGSVRKITITRAYVTSGDVTLPNTLGSWALLSTGSIPELAANASVGDEIEISIHCLTSSTANNYFDVVNVTGGGPTIQRYMATGTSSPALEGNPAYYPILSPAPSVQSFTAGSGDIDSGQVRFRIASLSAAARTLYASTNYPFYWQVKVFPQ